MHLLFFMEAVNLVSVNAKPHSVIQDFLHGKNLHLSVPLRFWIALLGLHGSCCTGNFFNISISCHPYLHKNTAGNQNLRMSRDKRTQLSPQPTTAHSELWLGRQQRSNGKEGSYFVAQPPPPPTHPLPCDTNSKFNLSTREFEGINAFPFPNCEKAQMVQQIWK